MMIHLFVRHCFYSNASHHKKREAGFSHEKCHLNLMETVDLSQVKLTFLLDTRFRNGNVHFIEKEKGFPLIEIDGGSEAKSFLALLDLISNRKIEDEEIVYFLEDDYLHRPGWVEVLKEGFTIEGVDYVTLYDHRDKYFFKEYESLHAQLFHTQSVHWRTTPSTTNTYAMRMKTLKRDLPIHRQYSSNRTISADHEKFLRLGKRGATLISPLPGWSTHAEPEFTSPCYDWGSFFSTV